MKRRCRHVKVKQKQDTICGYTIEEAPIAMTKLLFVAGLGVIFLSMLYFKLAKMIKKDDGNNAGRNPEYSYSAGE